MSKGKLYSVPKFLEQWCRPHPLQELFQKYAVVLVGDELGAFYLDKWATLTEPMEDNASNDPFYIWDKRNRRQTNVGYMEFVYAAFDEEVRDVVIDMAPFTQLGINEGLKEYYKASEDKSSEAIFNSLLANSLATPMDAVVQMAGSLEMNVHALNGGLSGIATLFREAKGIATVPPSENIQERVDDYMKDGFEMDKKALDRVLRRSATPSEIDAMREQMLMRLSNNRAAIEKTVFDESQTVQMIYDALENKPFLGFFQNARLFQSSEDLDDELRLVYGGDRVVRLSMISLDKNEYPKHPQYIYNYSEGGCTVAMTEDHIKYLQSKQPKPRYMGVTSLKA